MDPQIYAAIRNGGAAALGGIGQLQDALNIGMTDPNAPPNVSADYNTAMDLGKQLAALIANYPAL